MEIEKEYILSSDDWQKILLIEVRDFSTSSKNRKNLLKYNGRYFEVTNSVASLVKILKESQELCEVAVKFSELIGRNFEVEEVEQIIEKCVIPIINTETRKKRKTFWFEVKLLPAHVVELFSKPLKIFFHKKVLAVLLTFILLLESLYFITIYYRPVEQADIFSGYTFLTIFFVYIFSSFFHELGHASACKNFDINHGEVGFAMYLMFPVFYTDVSNVWSLSRKKRIVVNFAGTYFQLLFLIPLIGIYLLNPELSMLKVLILTTNINFLLTLNPFFRFDGYWIMSDLLGVPNLRKRSREYVGYLLGRLFRRKSENKPFLLTIRPLERYAMMVYSIGINLFFGYFFLYVTPQILYSFITRLPSLIDEAFTLISRGYTEPRLFIVLGSQILFFLFALLMVGRVLVPPFIKFFKLFFNRKATTNIVK